MTPLLCLIFAFLVPQALADYRVSNRTENSTSIVLTLDYSGNDTYYVKNTSTIYNSLKFTLTCHAYSDLSFQITDINDARFRIPKVEPFQVDPLSKSTFPLNLSQFLFTYTSSPFHFKLVRKSDNQVLFDSSLGSLIFSKYYLEISTRVFTKKVWGFGERYSSTFGLQTGKYTLWNKDKGERVDHQQGYQTYGYYPSYLAKSNSGDWYVTHLRNSNAMDVIVANDSISSFKLTYKIIGGMLDFRFILGDSSPQTTIERFHLYLGRSAIPPFWAMGFHQSRWGYHNVSMLEDVVKGYESNNIPLDTLWTDIDYMVDFEDFTIDETRFPLDRMANLSQKYHMVPIIDAGIKVGNGTGYVEGHKMDVFIKDPYGQEAKGWVWPGSTVFVDWFHPNATTYWVKMLGVLRSKYNFSGIWLDMNEISNFCDGPCVLPKGEKLFDYTHDIPYSPGTDTIQCDTISMNNTHYGNISQADVHVFHGMMETYATHQYLEGIGLRPFIITRSTTFGSNKYGFHWTGDNVASWEFLRNTIGENFMFQLWGIQMVGPDICGYTLNTTEELCARWFQLGSLYPFSRNHNDEDKIPQEAYALGPNVLQASRVNLKLRYSLLKEYYKHFVQQRGLGTIFRPLFFQFPDDINTYSDNPEQTQFLIGRSLMAAPVVTKGAENRSVYFPAGPHWFGFQTGREYHDESFATVVNKMTDEVPLFIREEFVVFTQDTTNVTKTSQLNNVFHMRGALKYNNQTSTPLLNRYIARGSLLSLGNYNDEDKLNLCIAEGCEYNIYLIVSIHNNGRTQMDLETVYTGGRKLNQEQKIESLTFYYHPNKTINYKFPTPVIINETRRQNFTLHEARTEVADSNLIDIE